MKKILSLFGLMMVFAIVMFADNVTSTASSVKSDFTDGDVVWLSTSFCDGADWITVGSTTTGSVATPASELEGATDYPSEAMTVYRVKQWKSRYLEFKVRGVSAITVYANCPNATATRTLKATVNKTSEQNAVDVVTIDATEGQLGSGKINLDADIENVVRIYADGDLDVYALKVTTVASTEPVLSVSPAKLTLNANPWSRTATGTLIVNGKNLADGTYSVDVPSIDGLSIDPTSFSVSGGSVSQEFTVSYTSETDVAATAGDLKFTVGDLTATATVTCSSKASLSELQTVSEATTWNFEEITATKDLSATTAPSNTDWVVYADFDDITFPSDFSASTIAFKGQYPIRSKKVQNGVLKFKTTVPGTITVDFSDTGSSASSSDPKRYLYVNDNQTEYYTQRDGTNDRKVSGEIDVKAGEVTICGWNPDAEVKDNEDNVIGTGATVAICVYKVVFTPKEVESPTFDFQNNNGQWPVGEGVDYANGNLTEPIVMDDVTLTGVQGEAMNPVRIMKNASRGICLWIYKSNSLKFNAPEGKAITKIEATMQTGSFDLAPSTGTVADNVWTGNATEVVFGPNANSTRYVWAFNVTLADENSETVKPAAVDIEVDNIAAFNAVEDGKVVKLNLTDARVNAYWDLQGKYFVEDATGATVIKGAALTAGTTINGSITGTKGTDSEIDYMNTPAEAVEYFMAASEASVKATATTLTGTVITLDKAGAQDNYGRLVTLENVAISGAGQNKTLTDATGNTFKARDYLAVLPSDFTWPENAASITGVVVYYMTGWFLLPISADAIVEAGATPAVATFDFTKDGTESLRGYVGKAKDGVNAMMDTKGWIYNETYTVDNVSLQITAGSAPSRIYEDNNNNRGINLVTYSQYSSLTFRAPKGKAITGITFTAAGNSNIKNFTASSGTIEEMTWTGNADGVRFVQGGTSYLATAVVTLADATDATAALEAITYTDCANIAAFNALESGTYAKLTLKDAEVTGISADGFSTAFIQDATGGCWIQYTSLNANLSENTKVNGTVYCIKREASGNPQIKETEDTPKSELTATSINELTTITATIAQLNENPADYLNKVAAKGAAEARENVRATLAEMRHLMGFRTF